MPSITRTLLAATLALVVHHAQALPVSNGGSAQVLMEVSDLDGNGLPDTFGAVALAKPAQTGAGTPSSGSLGPVDAPEPRAWLLVFALIFGVVALNRRMR